ncbi:MAG: hypothetical protein KGL39_39265 [Patescibacteria group bacterium]|nr:hypothetical protein [Patescibacteria group bacterium]
MLPVSLLPPPAGTFDKALKFSLHSWGDSLTEAPSLAKLGFYLWTSVAAGKLRLRGCLVRGANWGHSGCNTSIIAPGLLSRIFFAHYYETPTIGVVWCGTNDDPSHSQSAQTVTTLTSSGTTATATISSNAGLWPGCWITISGATPSAYNGTYQVASLIGSTQFTYTFPGGTSPATGTITCGTIALPQTQQNLMAAVKVLKFGCGGPNTNGVAVVGSQTQLPANTPPGTRIVVMVDTSTTGGAAASLDQTPRIDGDYSLSPQQDVWEARNCQPGEKGWGRVFVATSVPTHTKRSVVFGQHYLNYSIGGDTPTTEYAPYNSTNGLRYYQSQAAAAESTAIVPVGSVTSGVIQVPLTSITSAGTTATATSAIPHNLFVGAATTISGATPSGYNGSITVTGVLSSTQFTYTLGSPQTQAATGNMAAQVAQATLTTAQTTTTVPVLSLTSNGTTATAVTSAFHNLSVGSSVTISGATPSGYNGTVTVTGIVNQTSFTYTLSGSLSSPATGTIQAVVLTPQVAHGLWPGASFTLSGAGQSGYNGTFIVTGVPSPSQLTFTLAAPTQSPATGTISLSWTTTIYLDLRTQFLARINAGLDVQGSATWHDADLDVHLSMYGDELVAEFLTAAIIVQPGWLAAMM